MANYVEPEQPLPCAAATTRPSLVIVSSPRARNETNSPLLRLTRDHSDVLKRYEIHATAETASAILGTGYYDHHDVKKYRAGPDGGIAQLAAMAARRECNVAILFLDPSDPWSDAVENRALTRVCIQHRIRLITTYAAAIRWAMYETEPSSVPQEAGNDLSKAWKPTNWCDGIENVTERGEFKQLTIQHRSVALIAHDKQKLNMVRFLNDSQRQQLLADHHRILATGTTGWLLKLLFCSDPSRFYKEVATPLLKNRLSETMDQMLQACNRTTSPHEDFWTLLDNLRSHLSTKHNDEFASKVMPLPSGPDGGDVLAANEVLNHVCHEIIFFHDPLSAHPHNDDIRLLDRTCRLPGVFAECISDRQSAERWMEGLSKERREGPLLSSAQRLREQYGLKDVILINETNNRDSDELGRMLARACAGFLNHWLHRAVFARNQVRIGIAWGWGMRQVLLESMAMEKEGILERPPRLLDILIWSPIIGIITAEMTDREASLIAGGFRTFYGGQFEGFECAGFASGQTHIPEDGVALTTKLEKAELILAPAAPWNAEASLARNTGLDQTKLPSFSEAVGIISGVFLRADGSEVKGQYSIVGLGYEGLRQAAQDGRVVLVCGGEKRNPVVLAALRAGLVSVLVTTRQTADWVSRGENR